MTNVLTLRAALNRALPCGVKGCKRLRKLRSMSKVCQTHLLYSLRYGHPEQRGIEKSRVLKPWTKRAVAFFKVHRDDEPVIAAVDTMRELLIPIEGLSRFVSGRKKKGRGNNPEYFISFELERLLAGGSKAARAGRPRVQPGESVPRHRVPGVTPEEALTALSSVWLLYEHEPGNFVDGGGRTLNHALSRAVFSLREPYKTWSQGKPGQGREFSSQACNVFGQRCRDRLAPYLVNMTEAVKQRIAEEVQRAERMRRPLTPPAQRSEQARPAVKPSEPQKGQNETRARNLASFLTTYRPDEVSTDMGALP